MTSLTRAQQTFTIDVSAALSFGDEQNRLAATVFAPSDHHGEAARAVLVCWPGGSYGRAYWDMHVAGRAGYSFAERMTQQGFCVIAVDPLGVGDSSQPADVDGVTLEVMTDAAAEFVRQIRFGSAELDFDLGVEGDAPVVAVGHSLGGCLAVIEQASHGSYDGVVALGFTHGGKESLDAVAQTTGLANAQERTAAAVAQAKLLFGDDWDAGYSLAPREPNHAWFYRPSVPADVRAADDRTAVAWPRQSFVGGLLPGHSAQYAAAVTCPVLIGFGDHDIPEHPREDAGFYRASSDVTVVVVPDSGHCHNFATSRAQLWDRVGAWAAGLGTYLRGPVGPAS